MSSHLFSSAIMRELFKEIEATDEVKLSGSRDWAQFMMTKYSQQLQDQPVLLLTATEDCDARDQLGWLKTEYDVEVAEHVTQFFRGSQAADMREFLRSQSDEKLVPPLNETWEGVRRNLPYDDGPPSSFKQWFAIITVWRLTLAMTKISVPHCAFGSPGCRINPLPTPWKKKLNDCLRITKPSANIPANRGSGLALRRCDIDSILPALDLDINESGLLDNVIVDTWFRILMQRTTRKTIYIPSESLELVGSHPQEVAERAMIITPDIEMILFPTILPEHDHCILLVAYPQTYLLTIYDPLTPNTTKTLAKDRAWIKRNLGREPATEADKGSSIWQLKWIDCPLQGGEMACGVFMLVNALFAMEDKEPAGCYSGVDILFLRRYVAAVVCMGELPEVVLSVPQEEEKGKKKL